MYSRRITRLVFRVARNECSVDDLEAAAQITPIEINDDAGGDGIWEVAYRQPDAPWLCSSNPQIEHLGPVPYIDFDHLQLLEASFSDR